MPIKSETITKNDIEMTNGNINNYKEKSTDNEKDTNQSDNFGIDVLNASAKWILNQPDNSLNNINLSVRPGRLVAVIGPVGAGKVYKCCLENYQNNNTIKRFILYRVH